MKHAKAKAKKVHRNAGFRHHEAGGNSKSVKSYGADYLQLEKRRRIAATVAKSHKEYNYIATHKSPTQAKFRQVWGFSFFALQRHSNVTESHAATQQRNRELRSGQPGALLAYALQNRKTFSAFGVKRQLFRHIFQNIGRLTL